MHSKPVNLLFNAVALAMLIHVVEVAGETFGNCFSQAHCQGGSTPVSGAQGSFVHVNCASFIATTGLVQICQPGCKICELISPAICANASPTIACAKLV